jgi:hypothetical protein
VTSIDHFEVGNGSVGALTQRISKDYFDLVRGKISDHAEWRTLI